MEEFLPESEAQFQAWVDSDRRRSLAETIEHLASCANSCLTKPQLFPQQQPNTAPPNRLTSELFSFQFPPRTWCPPSSPRNTSSSPETSPRKLPRMTSDTPPSSSYSCSTNTTDLRSRSRGTSSAPKVSTCCDVTRNHGGCLRSQVFVCVVKSSLVANSRVKVTHSVTSRGVCERLHVHVCVCVVNARHARGTL